MNKLFLTLGIVSLFTLAFATAALVIHYSQLEVNMDIESPLILEGDLSQEITLIAGSGHNLYLVEGENRLDRDLSVVFQFSLLDGEGDEVSNTDGFYLAYTDDIEYAYKEEYGNASDWDDAKAWMSTNLDWFDWYLSGSIEDYDSSVMTNHGGDSVYENAIALNAAIPQDLSPGKFYAVVYFDVDAGIVPGEYTLSVDVMPQTV